MKLFSLLMLKNFHSHLSWRLSWTPSHKIMVSIISMNMNKTELPATKWFTIVHCRPWNMVHASNLNWNRCITGSVGVEPELSYFPQLWLLEWGCNGLKNVTKGLRDVKEGGISARKAGLLWGLSMMKSALQVRLK